MSSSPYHESGKIVNEVLTKGRSLKSLVFSSSQHKLRCSKASYALACNALKHKPLIDAILESKGSSKSDHPRNPLRKSIRFDETRNKGLLYILLYELLYGKYESIRGGGHVKRNVMKFEAELREAKAMVAKTKAGAKALSGFPEFPRYVRVNTLKMTTEDAIKILERDLCDLNSTGSKDTDGENRAQIFVDRHVPDLLVMPNFLSTKLHDHDLVLEGKVVLQDKSSCFPAFALVFGNCSTVDACWDGDVIDACSAPGNKTSHLAALVSRRIEQGTSQQMGQDQPSGSVPRNVFAFDKSPSRISLLRNRMSTIVPAVSNDVAVNVIHQDFLKVDPQDTKYNHVKCILLDPSCSGSGIVDSPDRLADGAGNPAEEKKRLENLSNFQLIALKRAMSFPQVDRIVYSTCSINEQENEYVVSLALSEYNSEANDGNMEWVLASPDCLSGWKRRGHVVDGLTKDQANCLIRCDGMDGDQTNGFFVSYFERRGAYIKRRHARGNDNLIKPPNGVDVYDGQYDKMSSHTIKRAPMNSHEEKSTRNTKVEGTKTTKKNRSPTKPGATEKMVGVPKKKAKKLAWKKKQMELRKKRLEKKKEMEK